MLKMLQDLRKEVLGHLGGTGLISLGKALWDAGGNKLVQKGVEKTLAECRGEILDLIAELPNTKFYYDDEYCLESGESRPSREEGTQARDKLRALRKLAQNFNAPMTENRFMSLLGKYWGAISNDELVEGGKAPNNVNNRRRMLRRLYELSQLEESAFWDELEGLHHDPLPQWFHRTNERARALGQRISDANDRRRAS